MPDTQDLRFNFDHTLAIVDILLPVLSITIQEIFDAIAFHRLELRPISPPNSHFAAAARESIAGIIQKGGFPEFVLQPINFDALYMQSLQQQQQQQQKGDGAKAETH